MSRWMPLIVSAGLLACAETQGPAPRGDSAADAAPWPCPRLSGSVLATVETQLVAEASGLAASRSTPGIFWTHNDAGDRPEVYGLDAQGQLRAICRLPVDVIDWEDIAIGPGPEAGIDYIYVGDIGDNSEQRRSVVVYRFSEPSVSTSGSPVTIDVADVAALQLRYPSGGHNAEALMVDPLTRDVYVITKAAAAAEQVYVGRGPQDATQPRDLQLVASMTIGSGGPVSEGNSFSGADISSAGDEIAIRTDTDAFIWHRASGASVTAALAAQPCRVTLIEEPNGEGITYDKDGVLYTLGEGSSQPIYAYRRQ